MGASSSNRRLSCADNSSGLPRSASCPLNANHRASTTEKRPFTSCNGDRVENNSVQVWTSSQNQAVEEEDFVFSERKSMLRTVIVSGSGRNVTKSKGTCQKHSELSSMPSSPLHMETNEANDLLWQKQLKIKVKPVDISSNPAENGSSSFRLDSLDANSGLKLLLSPVNTPSSRSLPVSSRFANIVKSFPSSGGLDDNLDNGIDLSKQRSSLDLCERGSDREGMGDSEEPGSPLFDPSILATFERAIEASSDDNWQTSEISTSSSSRIACSSSDVYSDADSPNWSDELEAVSDASCISNPDSKMANTNGSIGTPFLENGDRQRDYLDDFQFKCPLGCEKKIVFYFTSLRGIRKTYENCCLVRGILKGFGVSVDARDVWMHSKFREELTHVLGTALPVPRLFIKGRYIGGVEDVKRLHEEGILEYLLEGLPAEHNSMCTFCGSIRFVPCRTCNGSCKLIMLDEISRCPDCNENGLILCPSCSS